MPPNSIEITLGEQDAAKRRYVYKSQSFEFVSQDKLAGSMMKEVARTFEATRSLVTAIEAYRGRIAGLDAAGLAELMGLAGQVAEQLAGLEGRHGPPGQSGVKIAARP